MRKAPITAFAQLALSEKTLTTGRRNTLPRKEQGRQYRDWLAQQRKYARKYKDLNAEDYTAFTARKRAEIEAATLPPLPEGDNA